MPPRFQERMAKRAEVLKTVFGEPQHAPPPYPFSRGRAESFASSQSAYSQQSKSLPSPPPQYFQINQPGAIGYDKPAIPKNSLILVTGANSWQGIHVVDQLLEHGYRVRGTVRDAEKAIWTSELFKNRYGIGRYTTAVIPDMVPQGAFNIAARGCAGIIHVASVMTFSADPHEVITPSMAGALNALEAAAQEPSVKRFVYCSAAAAAVYPGTGARNDVTSDSWNMWAFQAAWAPLPYKPDRAWAVFASSKMQAEQAVWRWYGLRRPHFTLNAVLPATLWGGMLDPHKQGYRSSAGLLKEVFDGDAAGAAWTPPQHFVDVADSALLHVAALILPDVGSRRIFATNHSYNLGSVLQLLRGLCPGRVIEGDVSDHGVDLSTFREAGVAEEMLRRMGKKGWTDIETSVGRTCEAFLLAP